MLLWLVKKRILRYPVIFDYPVNPVPRYGYGKPPHPQLYDLIDGRREVYREHLHQFLQHSDRLRQIPREPAPSRPSEPAWDNGYFVGLDPVALYGFLSQSRPARYLEVGSGASTKFARKAVTNEEMDTEIISIDPHPRLGVDSLCDTVIRSPLDTVDLELFEQLERDDILFIDGSHRAFTNSDVAVVFLDILPRLNPGVLVHFHDIFLPLDYPPDWMDLFYSEQYLLASYLLGGHRGAEIALPNAFVANDPELRSILAPLWETQEMRGVPQTGGSFWLTVRDPVSFEEGD